MVNAIILSTGYFLDLIIGDPRFIPHPIRLIGFFISSVEKLLRRKERYLRVKGFFLMLIITTTSFFIPFVILLILNKYSQLLKSVVESILIFQILATKSLYTETNKVLKSLKKDDLTSAKTHLSYLVTRDCENMTRVDIIRSTIETISENIVDGITAPLFYIFLGGAPLGLFYKAVNTLDSMVGYKNKRYIKFGFFSAKLDDFINFIPARITSFIIIISSFILGLNYKNSIKIFLRDKRNHSSPNSGYAESPVAGALGITLGGTVSYFNEIHNKPVIGDCLRDPIDEDISNTHKIMFLSSFIFFLFCLVGIFLWNL